jgi:hypothetical protein
MAKKVAKYQEARLWEGAGVDRQSRPVKPGDIVDRPARGDLTCLYCPVPLSSVTASVNQKGTEIPAHLRLSRKQTHAVDCPLNFRTLMEGVRATERVEIDARDKKYFLRLPGEPVERAVERTTDTVRKRTNAPSWAATFASAVRIVKFMRQFDDDEAFANQLRIEYRNGKGEVDLVFWRDFCFEVSDEAALRRYYRRLSEVTYQTQISPVAMIFEAEQEPLSTVNGAKHRVTSRTNVKVRWRGRGDERELVVAAYSADKLANIHAGDRFLVLAHGRDWPRDFDNRVEIRLDVDQSWQIAKL